MKTAIIIPARYASSRFPGKPLAEICGKSLIRRVYEIAGTVQTASEVVVATDDSRISEHVESFGGKAVMTSGDCRNGSERVFDAVSKLGSAPEVVVNMQGDAVLTPPWVIAALIEQFSNAADTQIATPAVQLTKTDYQKLQESKLTTPASGTLVTFDKNFNALYFSKSLIPYLRNHPDGELLPVYRHIGMYAYRLDALKRYLELEPSVLELTEGLEQLRALENGIPIKVVTVDYKGRSHWSVDAPEDVKVAEDLIKSEGELV